MKNKHLAEWLQSHTDMLGSIDNEGDNPFHVALYEGLIDVAGSGDTRMINSVVESAATHAVASGRELTDLLGVHQGLRQRIWDRIGEEIDPEPAFSMLSALDAIFVHTIRVTIDAYQEGSRLALAAKSTEISRLYTESEKKVMQYATEVARANRELSRLEQAKTDFISIAAHELKTPLTLIQGYVNILQETQPKGEQYLSLIHGIGRGVHRMNSILEDMLDLSAMDMRQLSLVLQKIPLRETIDLVTVQARRALTEREHTLTIHGLDVLPEIEADRARLHQVFKQLLSNAIKYTPNGGQITISGEALENPARVRVTISDTGVGIAPEDREKIFEKFYRTGDSALHSTGQTKFMGAGPGLGLAIVKGLIQAHGGRIRVDSPGFDMQNFPGSRFIAELPVKIRPPSDVKIQWMMPDKTSPKKDRTPTSQPEETQ